VKRRRYAPSAAWQPCGAFSSPCCSLYRRPLGAAAEPQWIAAFGRATESQETDIVRLAYRHPLPPRDFWWMPSHVQLGASAWRVPDIRGTTRRFDLNATSIWRADKPWGYFEAGFGGYLLSRIGPGTLGIGLQHLSNAGIKQPNGGIDLVLVQYTLSR